MIARVRTWYVLANVIYNEKINADAYVPCELACDVRKIVDRVIRTSELKTQSAVALTDLVGTCIHREFSIRNLTF